MDVSFYQGKKVLVTGHTGFKGTWLCVLLHYLGAEVYGYSLEPPTKPSLFELSGVKSLICSEIGDVRDLEHLRSFFQQVQPEIVIHMAAQPIVRESYRDPAGTYEINVMGTVNVLECVRTNTCVRSFLNVTTDKVYQNNEWSWGYREIDPLDGYDPYSNSKSCSELVTHSYFQSFFAEREIAISTARAGNVIGGGDFSVDRIIPDCVRAVTSGKPVTVRNPYSVRPYQHVLEPLFAYLMIIQKQYIDKRYAGWYNVGPNEGDCVTTGALVELFCASWGKGAEWVNRGEKNAPHEASFLKLDCSRIKSAFNWKPRWRIEQAIDKTVEWTKSWLENNDIMNVMEKQIQEFMER